MSVTFSEEGPLIEQESRAPESIFPLYLCLLGTFRLVVRGEEVGKLSRAAKGLLALLALRRETPLSRDWLAETLWPDTPLDRSMFYLRRSLMELRTALAEEQKRLVSPQRSTLQFSFSGAFCDLIEFDRLTSAGDDASLEAAISLYHGACLEEYDEEWVLPERRRRAERYIIALENLAERRERTGAQQGAIEVLRRIVQTEPVHEGAYQRLMRLHAQSRNYGAVDSLFRELQRGLRTILQSEPSAETIALYQELRVQARTAVTLSPVYNLPLAISSLVGRQNEKELVCAALQHNRMVTLVGLGGIGKTRLALFAAESLMEHYPQGVCFVDLTAADNEEELPQVLAGALKLYPTSQLSPLESVRRFLQPRTFLLILDNAEHIVEACSVLAENLMRTCAKLTLLCTSRHPLYTPGEVVIPVPPLTVVDSSMMLEERGIQKDEATQLLLERIRSAAPTFRPAPGDFTAIASICQILEGLPLALELVAIRFRNMSAPEIATRLKGRFHLLNSGSPGNPRHRSLHATFNWSYELLTEAEQTLLRYLSVFRGGWTLEAAEAIYDYKRGQAVDLLLTSLVDKSLVLYEVQDNIARYRLLEMTRQYAAERLADTEREAVQQRHAEFFYQLAQHVDKTTELIFLSEETAMLRREHENLRAALAWLREHDTDCALGLEFLLHLMTQQLPDSTHEWIDRLGAQPMPATQLGLRVTYCVSMWALWTHHIATESLLQHLLGVARLLKEPLYQIRALDLLSSLENERGNTQAAWNYMEEAVRLISPSINAYFASRVTSKAWFCLGRTGAVEEAITRLEAQIQAERHAGQHNMLGFTLFHLSELLYEQGEYEQAIPYWNEAIPIAEAGQLEMLPYLWLRQARAALSQQDYTSARAFLLQSLKVSEQSQRLDRQGWAHWSLAELCFEEDCRREVEEHLRSAIFLFQTNHEPNSISQCLLRLSSYYIAWNQFPEAAILLGYVEGILQGFQFNNVTLELGQIEPLREQICGAMGAEKWEEYRKYGQQKTLEQVIDLALTSS